MEVGNYSKDGAEICASRTKKVQLLGFANRVSRFNRSMGDRRGCDDARTLVGQKKMKFLNWVKKVWTILERVIKD